MLDLNTLADRRAQALNQGQDGWRKAIWSAGFQKLSQSMSDGEVEAFVSYCQDVPHFESAVKYLEQKCSQTSTPPFSIVAEEASRAGSTPEQWFRKFASRA